MADPLQKEAPIIIIGAGTWGTSIAYQLGKRGYTNITVFDSHEFPSAIAAGNDINKILEEVHELPREDQDDESFAWATIKRIATKVWKEDPIYAKHYHNTGFIYAAVGDDAWAHVKEECLAEKDLYEPLENAAAFRATAPGVLTGAFEGWRGFIRRKTAGWVEARDTIVDLYEETASSGVKFICDSIKGKVSTLLFDESGNVSGVVTADGFEHTAKTVVVAAGASSTQLLDFEDQLRPTAWTLAHIALTAEEATSGEFNELPVLYGVDKGFFISPPKAQIERGTPELKICNEHPGYINLVEDPTMGREIPVALQRNAIPLQAVDEMKSFLQDSVPQLADRPLLRPRLCWDADTMDRLFLLSRHPRYSGLFVATGGSGNGFMCSPAIGVLVCDLIEGKAEKRMQKILGWRPDTSKRRDWFDTQGRFGGTGKVLDLKTFPKAEWTDG